MFKDKIYKMTNDKKAMIAYLTVNGDMKSCFSISEFEMNKDLTMLRSYDGHIIYTPTKDVKIEVLPWENVNKDGSNIKCMLLDEAHTFNMVNIEDNQKKS